jgi:hypothetical protein
LLLRTPRIRSNKEFLDQATERAPEIEEEPVKVALSPLENGLPTAELGDFSDDALEMYRQRAKIADAVGSDAFNWRLLRQGLLKEEDGVLVSTGFGFILFGREPRTVMRQAGLLGLIDYQMRMPLGNRCARVKSASASTS